MHNRLDINENTNRVIFVDIPCLTAKALQATFRNGNDATYTAITMLISSLRLVGITIDDLVLLCCNTESTWRTKIDPTYKRKPTLYGSILENLDSCTPFHILALDNYESYDIITAGVEYYDNLDCIIISSDALFEQLLGKNVENKHIKIFSPKSKRYKPIKNPLHVITKITMNKGEVLCEQDFNKKNLLYNLRHLSEDRKDDIKEALFFFPDKGWDYENLKYQKIVNRWYDIYKQDKVVDSKYPRVKKKKNKKQNQITMVQ